MTTRLLDPLHTGVQGFDANLPNDDFRHAELMLPTPPTRPGRHDEGGPEPKILPCPTPDWGTMEAENH